MRTQLSVKTLAILAAFGIVQCWAVDGKRINGRAVSVHWRYCPLNWTIAYDDARGYWMGSMNLFTINNGKVVRVDTIFKGTSGLCYNPAFDINGCKIAFYRLGRAQSSTPSRVTANGGKTTVSVMNLDGSVTNLADCPGEPCMSSGGMGGLDWPAGDWIYYLRPTATNGYMNQVWKVNINTKENVSVCTFDVGGSGGSFRRYSLNLAATKIGNQVIGGSWFNSNVNPFPNGCCITTRSGGCNSCVSPSGNYHAKFDGNPSWSSLYA